MARRIADPPTVSKHLTRNAPQFRFSLRAKLLGLRFGQSLHREPVMAVSAQAHSFDPVAEMRAHIGRHTDKGFDWDAFPVAAGSLNWTARRCATSELAARPRPTIRAR